MERSKAEAVIEAILFTMGDSVEISRLAEVIEEDVKTTKSILKDMAARYEEENRGIGLTQFDNSVQLCTKSDMYEYLIKIAKTPRKMTLTDTVLETLSIIAYKQPVTKMEIEKIRGVKSDHAVNRLVEYNLVYEVGRLDAPGRPALFATTEEFLRRFGVGSVQDLPDLGPEQEAEIKAEVEEELQLKLEELTVEAASGEAAETAETAMETAETAETAIEAAETAETAMEAAETAGTAMEAAATAEETAVAREPEA